MMITIMVVDIVDKHKYQSIFSDNLTFYLFYSYFFVDSYAQFIHLFSTKNFLLTVQHRLNVADGFFHGRARL